MTDNPLNSLTDYSRFVAELLHRPIIEGSTVTVWSDSPYAGVAEGEVFFSNDIRLRLREELDFYAGLITSYGYEVYRGSERLYWYELSSSERPEFGINISASQACAPRHQAQPHFCAGDQFQST